MDELLEFINNPEALSAQVQRTPATGKPLATYVLCDLFSGTVQTYEITSDGIFLSDEK